MKKYLFTVISIISILSSASLYATEKAVYTCNNDNNDFEVVYENNQFKFHVKNYNQEKQYMVENIVEPREIFFESVFNFCHGGTIGKVLSRNRGCIKRYKKLSFNRVFNIDQINGSSSLIVSFIRTPMDDDTKVATELYAGIHEFFNGKNKFPLRESNIKCTAQALWSQERQSYLIIDGDYLIPKPIPRGETLDYSRFKVYSLNKQKDLEYNLQQPGLSITNIAHYDSYKNNELLTLITQNVRSASCSNVLSEYVESENRYNKHLQIMNSALSLADGIGFNQVYLLNPDGKSAKGIDETLKFDFISEKLFLVRSSKINNEHFLTCSVNN